MVTVDFKEIVTRKCSWCDKEKEVYVVAFADQSFHGPLCKADLLRAVKMKCEQHAGDKQEKRGAGVTEGGAKNGAADTEAMTREV